MNKSWIAISLNNFPFGGGVFNNVSLHVIDKATLVDNAAKCPKLKRFIFKAPKEVGGAGKAFTMMPAQHYNNSGLPGDPLFLVTQQFNAASNGYGLWQIRNSGAAATALKRPALSRSQVTGLSHTAFYQMLPRRGQGLISTPAAGGSRRLPTATANSGLCMARDALLGEARTNTACACP